MFWTIVLLLVSLVILYFGADFLVKGSASLAMRLGISPLVIGLTVVAFATSAPELVVSIQSALNGMGDIAVGNVIGSNLFNVCAILGLSALIRPLGVNRQLVRVDLPVMLAVSALFAVLFLNGVLGRSVGILFVSILVGYLIWLVYYTRRHEVAPEEEIPVNKHWWLDLLLVLGGLALLVWGSDLLVNNAVVVARTLGWSEAVIGLTIVAVGTSVPELATSLVATIRKRADIAIGNIVGSNIFNVLAVLGITASISPIHNHGIRLPDLGVMLVTSLLLLPFMLTGKRISRPEGGVLFLVYVGYMVYRLS